jgi:8-oxo-dGTP pyrophosphatase MutT (NUDIX family)
VPERVVGEWSARDYEPPAEMSAAADAVLVALRERGSPDHDGVVARLAGYRSENGGLRLDLQRMRWSLRLVAGSAAFSAWCVVRDGDGRWLAGRRAAWVATWAGEWALGAAGAVDSGEDPVRALGRELEEEWGLEAERVTIEALVADPLGMVSLVGQAWVRTGAPVRPDAEHDAYAWWPADPREWPEGIAPELRLVGELLADGS